MNKLLIPIAAAALLVSGCTGGGVIMDKAIPAFEESANLMVEATSPEGRRIRGAGLLYAAIEILDRRILEGRAVNNVVVVSTAKVLRVAMDNIGSLEGAGDWANRDLFDVKYQLVHTVTAALEAGAPRALLAIGGVRGVVGMIANAARGKAIAEDVNVLVASGESGEREFESALSSIQAQADLTIIRMEARVQIP